MAKSQETEARNHQVRLERLADRAGQSAAPLNNVDLSELERWIRTSVATQDALNRSMVQTLVELRAELRQLEGITLHLDRELVRLTKDLGEVTLRVTRLLRVDSFGSDTPDDSSDASVPSSCVSIRTREG